MKKSALTKACFAILMAIQIVILTGCGGHSGHGAKSGSTLESNIRAEGVKKSVAPVLNNLNSILGIGGGSSVRANGVSIESNLDTKSITKQIPLLANMNILLGGIRSTIPAYDGNVTSGFLLINATDTSYVQYDVADMSGNTFELKTYLTPESDHLLIDENPPLLQSSYKLEGCIATYNGNELVGITANSGAKLSVHYRNLHPIHGAVTSEYSYTATIKSGFSISAFTKWEDLETPIQNPVCVNSRISASTSAWNNRKGPNITATRFGEETWTVNLNDSLEFDVSNFSYENNFSSKHYKYNGNLSFKVSGIVGSFNIKKFKAYGTTESGKNITVNFRGTYNDFENLNFNKPQIAINANETNSGLSITKAIIKVNKISKYPNEDDLAWSGLQSYDEYFSVYLYWPGATYFFVLEDADIELEVKNNNKNTITFNGVEIFPYFETANVKLNHFYIPTTSWESGRNPLMYDMYGYPENGYSKNGYFGSYWDYVWERVDEEGYEWRTSTNATITIRGTQCDADINLNLASGTLDAYVVNKGYWQPFQVPGLNNSVSTFNLKNMKVNVTNINPKNSELIQQVEGSKILVSAEEKEGFRTDREYTVTNGKLVLKSDKRTELPKSEQPSQPEQPAQPSQPEITIPEILENLTTGEQIASLVPEISDFDNDNSISDKQDIAVSDEGTKLKVGKTADGKRIAALETNVGNTSVSTKIVASDNIVVAVSYITINGKVYTIAFCVENNSTKDFKGRMFKDKNPQAKYDGEGAIGGLWRNGAKAYYEDYESSMKIELKL